VGVIMKEAGSAAGKHHVARPHPVVCTEIEDTISRVLVGVLVTAEIELGVVHPDTGS